MTFDDWFQQNAMPSPFIASHEMLVKGGAHATRSSPAFGLNTDPPRLLWANCLLLVRVLNEIRRRAAAPIYLTSVYRSPAYNRAIKGAAASIHMQFRAADITCRLTPARIATIAKQLRSEGFFSGGIGTYRTFTHVDTRGTNADW